MPMMFFYFLKIIFDISTSKRSKKYKPHSILAKKNSKFNEIQLQMQCQTLPKDASKLQFLTCWTSKEFPTSNLNQGGPNWQHGPTSHATLLLHLCIIDKAERLGKSYFNHLIN